jgi:hypothetical protein
MQFWLWLAGTMVIVAAAIATVDATLGTAKFSLTVAPMFVAYGLALAALGCVWAAARRVPFPLARAASAASSVPIPAREEVSAQHQGDMQQVLSSFQQALRQPGQLGLGENEDKAFAAHFPDLVPLRDEWNAAVMRAADAPSGVEHWLERECRALGEADDRCDSDAVLAALRGVVASTDYGRKGYVLTYDGWMTFPQDDTIKLIQRDARSVQREVAVLPAEPADTARDRCNAVIESINDIFVRAQQTSEWA